VYRPRQIGDVLPQSQKKNAVNIKPPGTTVPGGLKMEIYAEIKN